MPISSIEKQNIRRRFHKMGKLEQLEHLRSEDTPAASWLPMLWVHIGFQVKQNIQRRFYKMISRK